MAPMPAILDSSPIPQLEFPKPRAGLKRRASTASLPTPPQSADKKRHKPNTNKDKDKANKKRSGDKGDGSDSDEDEEGLGAGGVRKLDFGIIERVFGGNNNKSLLDSPPPKRLGALTTPQASPTLNAIIPRSASPSPSPGKDSPRTPSPRQAESPSVETGSPVRRSSRLAKKLFDPPVRDTPNNPFLDTKSPKTRKTKAKAGVAVPFSEPPTLTYVFRGQRTEFVNPHYKPSVEEIAASKLPIDHKDYSPSESLRPEQLFKEEIAKRKKQDNETQSTSVPASDDGDEPRTPVKKRKKGGWSDSESEEAEGKKKKPPRRPNRKWG